MQPIDNDRLKVSLFLTDEAGHLVGQVDDRLVGDFYLFEDVWKAGQPASSYHILPTLPATPPGRYDLNLAVYDSDTMQRYPVVDPATGQAASAVRIGALDVTRPKVPPYVTPQEAAPPDNLPDAAISLLGFDLPRTAVSPGDTLPLALYWRANSQPHIDYLVSVELVGGDGQPIVQRTASPAGDQAPTSQWRAGDILRGWQDLQIPPTTPAGLYRLIVRLDGAGQPATPLTLQQIEVSGRPHVFDPPPDLQSMPRQLGDAIEFLGYRLPTVSTQAGQPLMLTLYWRALGQIDRSYTVFVHILNADGQIVAQGDAAPAQGLTPTQTWVQNEIVADPHPIDLPADLPSGRYQVAIGMYDPATGARLPVIDADGQPQGDAMILAEPIQITSP